MPTLAARDTNAQRGRGPGRPAGRPGGPIRDLPTAAAAPASRGGMPARLTVVTALLVGGLTAILSIDDLPQAYNLQEGSVATQQVRAPRAIRFESAAQTAAARQAASDAVQPQYDFRAETARRLARRQLETLATALAPGRHGVPAQRDPGPAHQALASTLPGIPTAPQGPDDLAADRWSMVAADATRVLGMLQRGELRDSAMEATRRDLGERFSPQLDR